MKFSLENYLHQIDTTMQNKSKKDQYMIYFMIFFAIFTVAYSLFWDSSFEEYKRIDASIKRINQKITADQRYLQKNPPHKVQKLSNEIKAIEQQRAHYEEYNRYIKHKIESIASLVYDEQAWGEYLDSITTNAQKYHITLDKLTNTYMPTQNSFGHLLDITVNVHGRFKNTIHFINALERSDLVVDIHHFSLEANETLYSDFNISVWGIRY